MLITSSVIHSSGSMCFSPLESACFWNAEIRGLRRHSMQLSNSMECRTYMEFLRRYWWYWRVVKGNSFPSVKKIPTPGITNMACLKHTNNL
ncbi:hypothetical protein AVEN_140549-1 [Araneus ventricosus]|uniref:Uncharacterized protein n=1 Tax=Araneus ventricosus TaxID=182803 RepID=A0A4Y2U6N7_ARAVE|nr:hypothetical protein AVEN_140549-1 [Araneus ventricosus]